jgi:hypothetical protein
LAVLRTPFFVLAVVTMTLVVAFELSTLAFLRTAVDGTAVVGEESAPGLGAVYLALLDGILLWTTLVFTIGYFPGKAVTSRVATIVGLILAFFAILGALLMIILAFTALMGMVGLLLAAPFGTLAYLAAFGHFPKGEAVAALSFIILLKLLFLVFLALTDLGYLKAKGLMILLGISILMTWLTSFLIAFPPRFLSTITDTAGALITSVIAFVWLIVIFIFAIVGLFKVLFVRSADREV